MTEIVNLHKWPMSGDRRDVYVGRAGRGQTGYYGNPVEIGRPCPECREVHSSGGETLPCYRRYLERRLSHDRLFRLRVAQLHGRRLFCFCAPRPCHAQILAEWAARLAPRYPCVDFRRSCWCQSGRAMQCERCYEGSNAPCPCRACDIRTGSSVRRSPPPLERAQVFAELVSDASPGRAQRAPARVRRDAVALSEIRARRARVAPDRPPRGAQYVVPGHEDDPYVVHRVNRRVLVLQSRSGGFAVFEGDERPCDEWWR